MTDGRRRVLWHGTMLVLLGLATGGDGRLSEPWQESLVAFRLVSGGPGTRPALLLPS